MSNLASELKSKGFSGPALMRSDGTAYVKAASVFNGGIPQQPLIIGQCLSAADIQIAVMFATQKDLQIGIKSGGHRVVGYGLDPSASLLIDLSRFNNMQVCGVEDSQTLSVQPGALWRDVSAYTLPKGYIPIGGENPSVGVAGFVLGGGYGYLSRNHGLAVDNVVSMEVVDPDGQIKALGPQRHPDLYWAMCGAGNNNFGVLSKVELNLFSIPTKIFGGALFWELKHTSDIIKLFQETLAQDSGGIGANLLIITLDSTPIVSVVGMYDGPLIDGERAMAPFLNYRIKPKGSMGPVTYLDMEHAAGSTYGDGALWKTGFAEQQVFSAEALEIIQTYAKRMQTEAPTSLVGIEALGGAINRVPADASAFVHRSALWNFDIFASWPLTQPDLGQASERWAREFYTHLQPHLSGYVYQNYPDLELANWSHAYFGSNYPRLLQINDSADPGQRFTHRQGIGTELQKS